MFYYINNGSETLDFHTGEDEAKKAAVLNYLSTLDESQKVGILIGKMVGAYPFNYFSFILNDQSNWLTVKKAKLCVEHPFAFELQSVLEEKGITLKTASDTLGIPYRTIQDWKAGRRAPTQFQQQTIIEAIKKIN